MSFKEAVYVEHETQRICNLLHRTGFAFNRDAAVSILHELTERVAAIDAVLQIPPRTKEVVLKTKVRTDIIPFNPNSPKQLVELLDEHGWKPIDRTKTGKGWKVNERNLSTLPGSAPEGVHRLVERLMLESRVRRLREWLGLYNEDTRRIHGMFVGIGTWTHRMSHRHPNMGNIAAEKSIKYKSEGLSRLAIEYGKRFRELWTAGPETLLVGTDADGIQLRIFAHYINDPAFTKALVEGKKEDESDAHSLNARLLGVDRVTAKTFIYAFLLGAGNKKLGEILGQDTGEAADTKERFIHAYPGLGRLKKEVIPKDAERGYFEGLDGRYVVIPGDQRSRSHLALSGYLQNGEAVIMKHANVLWRKDCDREGIGYQQVNFVHDEWQTETGRDLESGKLVGELQVRSIRRTGERFGLRCPLSGNYKTGENWHETH